MWARVARRSPTRLRLLGLPPGVQHLLADGQLSAGHARALLGTPDRALQERLARDAVAGNWSVRAIEQAVRLGGEAPRRRRWRRDTASTDDPVHERLDRRSRAGPQTRLRPPGLLELEELLADRLETRVAVQMGAKRGPRGDRFRRSRAIWSGSTT